jgi:hypothetical protein
MIALILAGTVAASAQDTNVTELLKAGDAMTLEVARLRGLEPKSPILKGVKTKAEISRYLNERIQAEYDQGVIEKEGRVLQKLGLIPTGIDYRDFIIKLLTEQVGGFYDSDKKTFFIASWLPLEEQKPVMVHELAHALQDQYFDIDRMMEEDRAAQNDDRMLAHQALVEGDGMVVMLQSILESDPKKRHFSQLPDLAFIMRMQMTSLQSQYPVFKEAPAFLRETLLFPYGYGASFLQYAWNRDPSWQAVNRIYSDLPASTEQIMHPEKYFVERDAPQKVSGEDFASKLDGNWKISYKSVFGEFSLGLLLSLSLTEERSRRATAGWDGDQVLLLENGQGKDTVYATTVWDTAEDAEKFFVALGEWFRQRFPKTQRSGDSPAGFSIFQDGEFYSVRREGTSVRFIVGIPEADGRKLKTF